MQERLILVTDRHRLPIEGTIGAALDALPAGAALVMLREKDLGGRELFALAERVAALCAGRARLVVSERADVAAAVGAGVHLPERGLAVADARRLVGLVGASIHAPRETGADYAMLGPIFETPGKGPPLGVSALRGPGVIFAVGGIDGPERARACVDAGAHGVAVIRAVPRAAQIWAAVTSP